MTKGTTTILNFQLYKQTPGAIRYQEVDAKGKPLYQNSGATIGTIYIRKTALNGQVPKQITVAIDVK